jgi:hypothetical protein
MEGVEEKYEERFTLIKIEEIYKNLREDLLNFSTIDFIDELYDDSWDKYK